MTRKISHKSTVPSRAVVARVPVKMKIEIEDILERVTRAEERFIAATERQEAWHSATAAQTLSVNDRLTALEHSLAKYTGFWGAILLIISAVSTALMLAKEFLTVKFGSAS